MNERTNERTVQQPNGEEEKAMLFAQKRDSNITLAAKMMMVWTLCELQTKIQAGITHSFLLETRPAVLKIVRKARRYAVPCEERQLLVRVLRLISLNVTSEQS